MGTWDLDLAPYTCPHCDRMITARHAEIADSSGRSIRYVCLHCHHVLGTSAYKAPRDE
jgi:hypothetical protein